MKLILTLKIGIIMNLNTAQQEIQDHALNLVRAGSNYHVEELRSIYTKDFTITMLLPDGSIQRMDYETTIAMFTQRKDAGVPTLSEEATINHIDVIDDKAYVIITRHMDFLAAGEAQKIIFHLMFSKSTSGGWQVYREHATLSM